MVYGSLFILKNKDILLGRKYIFYFHMSTILVYPEQRCSEKLGFALGNKSRKGRTTDKESKIRAHIPSLRETLVYFVDRYHSVTTHVDISSFTHIQLLL